MPLCAEMSECWSQKSSGVSKTECLHLTALAWIVTNRSSHEAASHTGHHNARALNTAILLFTCKLLEHSNEVNLSGASLPCVSQPAKEQPRSFANKVILDCLAEAAVQTGKTYHSGYEVYFSLRCFHHFSMSFQNVTAAQLE